jgi:hypothetical protein
VCSIGWALNRPKLNLSYFLDHKDSTSNVTRMTYMLFYIMNHFAIKLTSSSDIPGFPSALIAISACKFK